MNKLMIVVTLLAATVMPLSANANGSASNLMESAQNYIKDDGQYLSQGYFMGMVQLYGDSAPQCVPPYTKYAEINIRVAKVIAYDPKVAPMQSPFEILEYAFNKAYPCKKI